MPWATNNNTSTIHLSEASCMLKIARLNSLINRILYTLNSLIKVPVLWKKTLPKSLAVLTFSCSTIGMNSRFLLVVLLFQRYHWVNFENFKLEINRNEHYLLWKWYIKVSLIHINLMCMVED